MLLWICGKNDRKLLQNNNSNTGVTLADILRDDTHSEFNDVNPVNATSATSAILFSCNLLTKKQTCFYKINICV